MQLGSYHTLGPKGADTRLTNTKNVMIQAKSMALGGLYK